MILVMKLKVTIAIAGVWLVSLMLAYQGGRKQEQSAESARQRLVGESERAGADSAARGSAARAGRSGGAVTGNGGNLKQVMAQLKQLGGGGMMNPSSMMKMFALIGQIRDEDIQPALKLAGDMKEQQTKMMLTMALLSRWAENDGPAALAYANEHFAEQMQMKQMSMMGILSSWAESDPDAVWQYLRNDGKEASENSGGMGASFRYMSVFSSMARKDPDMAFRHLRELTDQQERQMAMTGIAQAVTDVESAKVMMEHVSRELEGNNRTQVLGQIMGQMSMYDGAQARELIAAMEGKDKKEVLQQSAHMLMMQDPRSGADFMVAQSAPEDRAQVYERAVGIWAQQDIKRTGEWLEQQPTGSQLDGAWEELAQVQQRRDPAKGLQSAAKITDASKRLAAVQSSYLKLHQKDAAAADAAIESMGFSPSELSEMQQAAKKQPKSADLKTFEEN